MSWFRGIEKQTTKNFFSVMFFHDFRSRFSTSDYRFLQKPRVSIPVCLFVYLSVNLHFVLIILKGLTGNVKKNLTNCFWAKHSRLVTQCTCSAWSFLLDCTRLWRVSSKWPKLIADLFFTKNLNHAQRPLISAFVIYNGLNPEIATSIA